MAEGQAKTAKEPPSQAPAAVAEPVILHGRFSLHPDQPLPGLASPNAQAFAADDRRTGVSSFVLAMAPDLPLRLTEMAALKGMQFSCVMPLLDFGQVFWPPANREVMVAVFERPLGGRLVESLQATFPPLPESEFVRLILKPMAQGLQELKTRNIVHRAIRPTNMFFMDAARTQLAFGECVSSPPGFDQPAWCEPIESAMAMPEGRGLGTTSSDLFSMGVTLFQVLTGRRPGGNLSEADLQRARVAHGSYAALTGESRFPLSMVEVLRGLLVDDPLMRWDMDALNQWMEGRRLTPVSAKPEKRAQRAFRFCGKDYLNRRELATALVENWDQAAAVIQDGQLEVWLRRGLDEKTLSESVAELVRQCSRPPLGGGTPPGPDVLVAKTAMLLDPMGPVRYRGVSFQPEALGSALAVAATRKKDVRVLADCILREIPEGWFAVQTVFDPLYVATIQRIKDVRTRLRMTQPGFGVERCLYDLNENLPCLSPMVQSAYVLDIEDLLPALDQTAKSVEAKTWPADRHIIAFIASRFILDVEKQINALNSPQAETSALGLLSLLAVLQWKLGPEALFDLTSWVAGLANPIIASYHNREVRRRLEKEIPRLVRKGSLPDLYNTLDNVEERQRDLDGFAWAKAEYAGAEQEIRNLERDTAKREEQAQKIGQQTAGVLAVLVGLITISVLVAMQFW